ADRQLDDGPPVGPRVARSGAGVAQGPARAALREGDVFSLVGADTATGIIRPDQAKGRAVRELPRQLPGDGRRESDGAGAGATRGPCGRAGATMLRHAVV